MRLEVGSEALFFMYLSCSGYDKGKVSPRWKLDFRLEHLP